MGVHPGEFSDLRTSPDKLPRHDEQNRQYSLDLSSKAH